MKLAMLTKSNTLAGVTIAAATLFSASSMLPKTSPASTAAAASSGVRGIFMNGTDISGARNQFLKNVDIQISESGDIFIIAPHYQVSEEDAYTPLSRFVQGMNTPAHKPPQKRAGGLSDRSKGSEPSAPGATQHAADTPAHQPPTAVTAQQAESSVPVPKAGTPVDESGSATPFSTEKAEDAPPALPE